jgi:RNA polymerase-binding transcription factor DksA
MATKKPVKKAAAKKSVKPAPKAAKKAAPAKKAVKAAPAKKVSKPVPAKKVAKPAPAKKAVKPVPAKKAAKPAPAKKVVKSVPAKKVAKPVPAKKVVKPVPTKKAAKPAPVKKVAPVIIQKKEVKKEIVVEVKAKKAEPAKPVVKAPEFIKKVVAKNPKDIKIAPAKPVVLPKINTKTSRSYEPDFTKSVLDSKKVEVTAPLVKYSDAELMEFKEIILKKMNDAKKELHFLQGLITRKDDTGGDESENRYMTMEDGSLSMEREQLSQMASRQITFIDHLEKAIMRIENKTYGICRVTGKLIDKARLRAVPHATLSIEAKMGIKK